MLVYMVLGTCEEEYGSSVNFVGIYSTEEKAKKVALEYNNKSKNYEYFVSAELLDTENFSCIS